MKHAAYETSDLNLASFLRSRGFPIRELREGNARTLFTFPDDAALREAVLDFANDGSVGVRSFCSALRDLKAITRRPGREGSGSEW